VGGGIIEGESSGRGLKSLGQLHDLMELRIVHGANALNCEIGDKRNLGMKDGIQGQCVQGESKRSSS